MMQTVFRTLNVSAIDVAIQTVHFGTHEYDGASLATSLDWTMQEVVTPVKNQGQRGSRWALSTTSALEVAWTLGTDSLVSVSEQQAARGS